MNINIKNHSALFKFNLRIKNSIIQSIKYILKMEKEKGDGKFKKFIKKTDINNIEINLLFIDDKEMIEYNKKCFNKKTPTDVIAFSMIEGIDIKNNFILGDAVISVETAKKNSKIYGHSLINELFLLIVHTTLHLIGYEHPSENCKMRRKEKKYFEYINKKLIH